MLEIRLHRLRSEQFYPPIEGVWSFEPVLHIIIYKDSDAVTNYILPTLASAQCL